MLHVIGFLLLRCISTFVKFIRFSCSSILISRCFINFAQFSLAQPFWNTMKNLVNFVFRYRDSSMLLSHSYRIAPQTFLTK